MAFNLVQLRAFVAAAETLSFTSAAERVHVAQPTFSATIRNLEDAIGARLFERTSRTVRLTHVGAELLPLARRVLDEVDRTQAVMADVVAGRRGAVRFSAVPVLYAHPLHEALKRFHHQHPGVRLELLDLPSGDALERLRREQLDLAIVTELEAGRDIRFERLSERTGVAVLRADHPLAALPAIEWRQLLDHRTVALQASGPFSAYMDQCLLEAGLKFTPDFRVEQIHAAGGIVAAGLAIAVMTNLTASALERDGLVARPLVAPSVSRPLGLAHLATRELSPAARALRSLVLAHWPSDGPPVAQENRP